jgi:hypothetical protein
MNEKNERGKDMNCKCCWTESEGTFCSKCSEFSVLEQIEEKKKELMIFSYKMLYHTLKHDLEHYDLEDVKEMYSYLEEDLFAVLNKYCELIQRLEEEIEELKLHKEVRLQFLFVEKGHRRLITEVFEGKDSVHFMLGIDKDYEFKDWKLKTLL